MKRWLPLLIIFLLLPMNLWAAAAACSTAGGGAGICYVDMASAGGDGTTTATAGAQAAFQHIAEVNALTYAAGDQILFNKGQTWRETLTVPTSGEAGTPITIGAYGTGAAPIINGSNVFSSWTEEVISGGGVLTDSLDSGSTALNIFHAADHAWAGTKFTAGSTYYIGSAQVKLTKAASPTMTITAYIYSDNSDTVGTLLGTSTTTLDASTISGGTYHSFTFAGTLQLSSGTKYWLVLGASATNGTNYVVWTCQSYGGDAEQSADGSTWSDTVNWFPNFKTYTPVTAGMTVYYATDTVIPNVAWENGTPLLKRQTKAALTAGSWWYDDPNDRLYVRTSGDNNASGYTITAGYRDYGIDTNGSDYITIKDLNISYTNKYGIIVYTGTTNTIIQDCVLSQNGFGIHILGTSTLITRCTISDGHIITDDAAAGNDYGAVAINIENSGVEISYCTISNMYAPSTDFGEDGGGIEIYQYDNATVENISIHHNSLSNTSGVVEMAGGTAGTVQHVSFYYNIFRETRAAPDSMIALHNGGAFGITLTDITFYNNTVISTGTGTGALMWFAAAPGAGLFLLKNNIFYTSNMTVGSNQEPSTHTNNIYRNTADVTWAALGYAKGATESFSDPLFVSAATGNFKLQAGSPAINAGVGVGLSTDYSGMPIVANPDIGAYEYMGGSFGPQEGSNWWWNKLFE